ncbi:DNA-protecting protein DprA [Candidatus Desantisbacteria bacterium CG_4_10_14_0_8_um_filter_48_22]|uniref:DNA-protecting protein DprA n=1 Tax=Candidatus Desantisbacteria bacterium CG_4_10_14_0_8_um_filter_48_22 TaxID=1974543 RepID=A0A2M7SAB3_9BACT|nr:MAG: DNA protecting protein DprA [Candidatus Desantisbacteria bacterium CG1_02_49_89]PIV54418.1 MAG: DNA-protecting protein DprA [Candidatus Desantisbacteria bacterium CG02_land_8_20_14_3_00_49_13]PIZ16440.1 MAG: DNA-protecting protein DprA [Candidatus Desantisbacteria bacterium CG_4_10_14_0_8_um_filter_48_22]PJB27470.1 MAG: DNA-protecting protein DprA [Candidatus Desantisbacteria bacterium CG_4_9_14_3_um_filter_50_7]
MENEKTAWVALNMAGIGSGKLKNLLQFFGSPEGILGRSAGDLGKTEGIGEETARRISGFADGKAAKRELEKAEKTGVRVMIAADKDYPFLLSQIYDPPIVLYVKGKLLEQDRNAVGIVGSRRPSIQGRLNAEKLGTELASRGFTVVSGMARGIDTAGHRGALSAKGRTIAVMGSGLDVVYPPENKGLMDEISRSGAVISEFPFGTKPDRQNFPRRNRVVSGLSLGVVVVEAGEKSGALITAGFALEQGREVFAVPGNVNLPTTKGCHQLIRDGAKLVEKVEDILEELNTDSVSVSACQRVNEKEKASKQLPLNNEEAKIYELISGEPVYIDELAKQAGTESYKLSQVLVNLEIRGLIKQLPGKYYVKR